MRLRILAPLSLVVLTALIAVAALNVRGQNSASASPPPAVSPAVQPSPSPGNDTGAPTPTPQPHAAAVVPRVIKVIEGHLELDDIIQIEVDHLAEWMTVNDAKKLVPYINGRAIRGNYPEEIHSSKNHLIFHLEVTPENKDVWTDLLGAPAGAKRPVAFTVGLEEKAPFESNYDQTNMLPLTVISPTYGVVSLLVVLFTLIFFVWLAKTTHIIREPGPPPPPGKLRPYNLGRTQMAFWFFLVYVSYLVIWLITNALDTITASLLGLMGISAGTALSEAMIDSSKSNAQENQLQDLSAEKQTLEQTIVTNQAQLDNLRALPTAPPDTITDCDKALLESRTRLAQVDEQIQSLTLPASANVSGGFLRDILSDSTGYSFHRFQIFAWTIVLGIIFVSAVYNNLTMPEFSPTLLGLMGLSSGTYIGFKFPEKK